MPEGHLLKCSPGQRLANFIIEAILFQPAISSYNASACPDFRGSSLLCPQHWNGILKTPLNLKIFLLPRTGTCVFKETSPTQGDYSSLQQCIYSND